MTLPTTLSKVRKGVGLALLAVLTVVVIFAAWPIRDSELVARISVVNEDAPIELYDESLLCTTLPDCYRITYKAITAGTRLITEGIVELFHLLPGNTVTEAPAWAEKYARNIVPYLMLRVLVLIGLAYALRIYVTRWWMVAVMGNILLFWSTGVPIRAAVSLYESSLAVFGLVDYYPDIFWFFSRNSTVFLLEYDYLALVAVLIFPLLISRQVFKDQVFASIAFGFVLAITFEHLAAVYIIGLWWSGWRTTKHIALKQAVAIGTGWLIPIVGLFLFARFSKPDDGIPLVEITKLGYSINSYYMPLVRRLLIGFLVLPYLLGMMTDFVLARLGVKIVWHHQLRVQVNGVIFGLLFSFFIGYFHSALATEFGRQSIGAQVLLFLSGFLAHQARRERKQRTQGMEVGPTSGGNAR